MHCVSRYNTFDYFFMVMTGQYHRKFFVCFFRSYIGLQEIRESQSHSLSVYPSD